MTPEEKREWVEALDDTDLALQLQEHAGCGVYFSEYERGFLKSVVRSVTLYDELTFKQRRFGRKLFARVLAFKHVMSQMCAPPKDLRCQGTPRERPPCRKAPVSARCR